MKFDLSTLDWTAISSVVSLIMVVATFITLWVNGRQLKEMKRQWREEHRPNIQTSIVVKNGHFLVCVRNVGNELAMNVKLQFNDFFKKTMMVRQLKKTFVEIESIPYIIPAHDRKYFYFMPTLGFGTVDYPKTNETITGNEFEIWVKEHEEDELSINCTYTSQGEGVVYHANYSTVLNHCFGHTAVVIDNEVDAILEANKILHQIEKRISKQN